MKSPFDQQESVPSQDVSDDRLADAPQAEQGRPDLDAERKYPNGSPTYTSTTAVPGELPWAGTADPSVAAGFTDAGVKHVQTLIEKNLASSLEWQKASEAVDDTLLKGRFAEISGQRRGFADELQDLVRRSEAGQGEAGVLGGAVRRWWNGLGSSAGSARTRQLLEEGERAEDTVLQAYRAALKEDSLGGIARVISDQTVHVQRVHDEIKLLRDHWRTR